MMTAQEIRELDAQTVERIAAGEVVERPASAVKELVENSLDADASRVTVAVEAGGTGTIRVTDNGVGMDETALRQAVEKHTTSKLRDIDDLESGVTTLGFRGEALHAIGAVSRLTLTSRPRGGDRGAELTVEGGEITDVSPAGCPEGTSVEVRDLFYNVPARRKYLKTETTEFAHVNTVVTNYALANPDVAVTLEHDGRETFATTGSGDHREAVLEVYGREVAEAMIPVADETTGPIARISGLVSHPETNRASREYLSTFVNGRYVTAKTVREAVVDAYGGQLAPDRYPFAVLFLDVDPTTVDVNVHPRKLEIRFSDEEGVREQVRSTVEDALLDAGLIRSSAPRGRSAAAETEIRPETSELSGESTPSTGSESDEPPAGEVTDSQTGTNTRSPVDTVARTSELPDTNDSTPLDSSVPRSSDPDSEPAAVNSPTGKGQRDASTREPASKFRTAGRQKRLTGGEVSSERVEFEQLPALRLLGQFRETYIVAETADGLVLVDQHAADERINYERLRETVAGETTTQALAEPVRLELTAREAELFEHHAEALTRLGFHASLVDERVVEVSTLPALVAETAGPELVRDVLGEFVRGDVAATETVEAAVDELLGDLACYPSITGNTSLTEGSVVELLAALDECENPYACPHGRPVVIEFDTEEIEARFERDYPGHS